MPKKAKSHLNDISSRLHDTVAQELTASAILAHVIAIRLQEENHPQAETMGALQEKITLASAQLREIMLECSQR